MLRTYSKNVAADIKVVPAQQMVCSYMVCITSRNSILRA